MKKLMTVAIAALWGAVGLAAIESANIVGYSSVVIPAQQYTMIGAQFNGLDGVDGISIQDLIQNPLESLPGAANPNARANAVRLLYWDPNEEGNYIELYLCNKAGSNYGKWCTTTQLPTDTTWGTSKNSPSTKVLISGMGLWLVRPTYTSSVTVQMCGQVVVAQGGRTYSLHSGYNMISGAFSTDFAINDGLDWVTLGLTGAANPNARANADRLLYWDPNEEGNYIELYLCNKAGANYGKWCTTTQLPADTSWGTAKNAVSPKSIPMGRGFWLVRPSGAGSVTITLPQPYSL